MRFYFLSVNTFSHRTSVPLILRKKKIAENVREIAIRPAKSSTYPFLDTYIRFYFALNFRTSITRSDGPWYVNGISKTVHAVRTIFFNIYLCNSRVRRRSRTMRRISFAKKMIDRRPIRWRSIAIGVRQTDTGGVRLRDSNDFRQSGPARRTIN